jgi:hypothetical protein
MAQGGGVTGVSRRRKLRWERAPGAPNPRANKI